MKRTSSSLLILIGLVAGLSLILGGCFQMPGDAGIDMVAAPLFITFVNDSDDPDVPMVFVFAKNASSSLSELTDEIAWRVMPTLARGASNTFMLLPMNLVQATWGVGNNTTALVAAVGQRYSVVQDSTGIVLVASGSAAQSNAVEVSSHVNVDGGITAHLLNDNRLFMQERIVAYGQKATFVVEPKLYWGIASDVQEGQMLSSAALETNIFFEQNLAGVSQATVTLTGNSQAGYQFEASGT